MGLFDGKAKKESAENEVLQKLSQVPLLDLLIENVLHEENEPWITMGQSYYDSCRRVVKIEPDGFEIKWSSYHDEPCIGSDGQRRIEKVEDVHGQVGYSYTKSGYLLHFSPFFYKSSLKIDILKSKETSPSSSSL